MNEKNKRLIKIRLGVRSPAPPKSPVKTKCQQVFTQFAEIDSDTWSIKPVQPVDPFGEDIFSEPTSPKKAWQAAVDQADRILEKIEETGLLSHPFLDDVAAKVKSVQANIVKYRSVTAKQQAALSGWEGGVDKFLY